MSQGLERTVLWGETKQLGIFNLEGSLRRDMTEVYKIKVVGKLFVERHVSHLIPQYQK